MAEEKHGTCVIMRRNTLQAYINSYGDSDSARNTHRVQGVTLQDTKVYTLEEAEKRAKNFAAADATGNYEYMVFELRAGFEKEPPPPPPVQKTKYTNYCSR